MISCPHLSDGAPRGDRHASRWREKEVKEVRKSVKVKWKHFFKVVSFSASREFDPFLFTEFVVFCCG